MASVRVSTGREAIEDDRCPLPPSSNDGPRAGDDMALLTDTWDAIQSAAETVVKTHMQYVPTCVCDKIGGF